MDRQNAINTINGLYDKYENNPYMLSKINNYVVNQLPTILENINANHIERQTRIDELTQNQDQFIDSFLNNNRYFYISTTENFFFYDEVHYQLFNEDDIIYHILSTISREKELSSWKQSTKNSIMKRIRENSLLKSIPESETIQIVIDSLCPILFKSRTEAKYFLTILGDNILKKHNNNVHYIDVKAKHFIRNFNHLCQMWLGQNFYQTFKHKYHDHDYNNCRIIDINEIVKTENVWNNIISQFGLDIICVACHYSQRYSSSDDYVLKWSNDNELIQKVFYLKNNSQQAIVNKFVFEYLNIDVNDQPSVPDPQYRNTQITWRDMQYLWKNFLESKKLPSIMFLQTLKAHLIDNLKIYYNETTDSFVGICSKHLPEIQKFLQYWEETIIFDENEMDFEIEEVILLFRKWCFLNNEFATSLNDKQILDVISYFYPTIEIEHDKYISKIRSVLWDKHLDIQVSLDDMRNSIREKINSADSNRALSPSITNNVSIYDAYKYYYKYFSNINDASNKLIVSKSYFEKYILDTMPNYVVDSKFISIEWVIL
jgi:hypothetical protein